MKRKGEIASVVSMFDDEIIALVRRTYADDFAVYAAMIALPCLFP